jgi:hypothetical protein
MSKLKSRRAAHRLVAEAILKHLQKTVSPTNVDDPVRVELRKILDAHFAAGTIKDDVPDEHEVLEPMALASGGENRCQGCGGEIGNKTKARCPKCEDEWRRRR